MRAARERKIQTRSTFEFSFINHYTKNNPYNLGPVSSRTAADLLASLTGTISRV